MGIFEALEAAGHEQLIFCQHQPTGLRALVAIHDTTLGPALGGCRLWSYPDEESAVADALRLAESSTYQMAAANTDAGGGMAVLLAAEDEGADEAALRAFGRFIDSLGGRFVAYSDLGTDDDNIRSVGRETAHVRASSPGEVDSETACAWGVFHGISAALNYVHNNAEVAGRTIALQGVGGVGSALARILVDQGAELILSDLRFDPVKELQDRQPDTRMVRPDEIYDVDCDVFCPCAVGGVLDAERVERLKAKIVAGSAFNVLTDEALAARLAERGILFVPEFIINAGDTLMHIHPGGRTELDEVRKGTQRVYRMLGRVFNRCRRSGETPLAAAKALAREKIARIGLTKSIRR